MHVKMSVLVDFRLYLFLGFGGDLDDSGSEGAVLDGPLPCSLEPRPRCLPLPLGASDGDLLLLRTLLDEDSGSECSGSEGALPCHWSTSESDSSSLSLGSAKAGSSRMSLSLLESMSSPRIASRASSVM